MSLQWWAGGGSCQGVAHLVLGPFGLGHGFKMVGQADHVVAWGPAKFIVSEKIDRKRAIFLQSHEFAAYPIFGHHL